jgi:hypothetical protein
MLGLPGGGAVADFLAVWADTEKASNRANGRNSFFINRLIRINNYCKYLLRKMIGLR